MRGFGYCALDSRDRLNTIRAKLNKLRVIFIDGINFLNSRLEQIMGTNEPFGGISLVTVGHLFQLKPDLVSGSLKIPNLAIMNLQLTFGQSTSPSLN